MSKKLLGGTDGKHDTIEDPGRSPLLVTPNFAEYPSAHATIDPAVQEAFDARIYGGIHFPAACLDGCLQGNQVGALVVHRVARSVHATG